MTYEEQVLHERIEKLEKELQDSTDQNDLVLDEFVRVKCLTDNTEIHQLCERAHLRMRQKVPVIERNHRMEKRIKELEQWIAAIADDHPQIPDWIQQSARSLLSQESE